MGCIFVLLVLLALSITQADSAGSPGYNLESPIAPMLYPPGYRYIYYYYDPYLEQWFKGGEQPERLHPEQPQQRQQPQQPQQQQPPLQPEGSWSRLLKGAGATVGELLEYLLGK
ncbi:hypothetical protein KIN20_011840 [Parelaphostrongylus tenuis]|uniref:Uncharacterized protein n=1 Tax=Parelaphostrongylus tenuis TaxID=148309 RepID=A0AAD5MBE4_PARTN|nr:hypothetical protein KIN20_011840 [Parelaphostrongylus tenuis]